VRTIQKPHEEVTPPAPPLTRRPAVRPESTVIGRRNMRPIVDQSGKTACRHEQIAFASLAA
jgi:hypothetical protein